MFLYQIINSIRLMIQKSCGVQQLRLVDYPIIYYKVVSRISSIHSITPKLHFFS